MVKICVPSHCDKLTSIFFSVIFYWATGVVVEAREQQIRKGHLDPLGNQGPSEGSVIVLDGFLDPETFFNNHILEWEPVLFKGAAKDIPAYSKWTDTYLRENYGNIDVEVEKEKKETRNEAAGDKMTFSKFLDIYQTAEVYCVQDVVSEMKGDLILPACIECGGFDKLLDMGVIWFSSGQTKSVLHYDALDNINCLLDGHKSVILFDRDHQDIIEDRGFNHEKSYSHVDVDAVDLEKFPGFQDLPWIGAEMEKGDCLYIPKGWYHQVNSAPGRNLAVNLWFGHALWFNDTDCAEREEPLPEPNLLSNYILSGIEPAQDHSFERLRVDLFEGFDGLETVSYPMFMEEFSVLSEEEANEMFDEIDADENGELSWEEMYSVDLNMFTDIFDLLFGDVEEEDYEYFPHKDEL